MSHQGTNKVWVIYHFHASELMLDLLFSCVKVIKLATGFSWLLSYWVTFTVPPVLVMPLHLVCASHIVIYSVWSGKRGSIMGVTNELFHWMMQKGSARVTGGEREAKSGQRLGRNCGRKFLGGGVSWATEYFLATASLPPYFSWTTVSISSPVASWSDVAQVTPPPINFCTFVSGPWMIVGQLAHLLLI